MVKLLGALIALLLAVPAVGQSLSMVDLTRVFHMSPDDLPEFMRGKGWNGNTTVIDGDAFDMGWQYNNVEDIVVKKSADGSKFVSYRLHRQEDIDAYRAGQAMIAVDADTFRNGNVPVQDFPVVALSWRCGEIRQRGLHFLHALDPGHAGNHSRPVQAILHTFRSGHGLPEGIANTQIDQELAAHQPLLGQHPMESIEANSMKTDIGRLQLHTSSGISCSNSSCAPGTYFFKARSTPFFQVLMLSSFSESEATNLMTCSIGMR